MPVLVIVVVFVQMDDFVDKLRKVRVRVTGEMKGKNGRVIDRKRKKGCSRLLACVLLSLSPPVLIMLCFRNPVSCIRKVPKPDASCIVMISEFLLCEFCPD